MSAIPPLAGDKQTSGEPAKSGAIDPLRNSKKHLPVDIAAA
jgi:hypothetical protein